ncbi:hypothetical protein L7F22_055720 [Adiantum nelumboides]|nr:hypothetical protein [Adiantum nelumboides]
MDRDRIAYRAFSASQDMALAGDRSSWYAQTRDWFSSQGLDIDRLPPLQYDTQAPTYSLTRSERNRVIRQEIWHTYIQRTWVDPGHELPSKMLHYREHFLQLSEQGFIEIPLYMQRYMPHHLRVVIGQLRVSSHQLEIERGIARGLPRDERICPICHTEVESEEHFMVRCPAYSALRVQFGMEDTLQQCIARSDQVQLGRFLTAALGIREQILQPRLQAGERTQRTITEFFQREEMLDVVGMDLPSILVKFIVITEGPCKEFAQTLLNTLLENCDPRLMFSAYMEALHSYSVLESLELCHILLDGLPKILSRLRRRRAEYFKASLQGLLKVAGVAADTCDLWRILDKVAHIVLVVLDISAHEEVTEQKQRLHETLGISSLLLLARFSGFEQLDGSSVAESSLLQLARLLPRCGLTDLSLVTGSFLGEVNYSFIEELVTEDGFINEARQGAAIAVWWRFCFEKAASVNEEGVTSVIGGLKNSRRAFVSALSSVLVLLSSIENTSKRVEMGIDLLTLILEWGTAPSTDNLLQINPEFLEDREFLELTNLLQMVQNVVIFFPRSRTRQIAYKVMVDIIRKVLPAVERFKALKHLIIQTEHSSMVSLLLYVTKAEVDSAISSTEKSEGQALNSPFASEQVLELIKFVLRPPNGCPPDLPVQTDAVLSALNLYRFLLIKEAAGKSNYTGVLSYARLEEACSQWLQPLRTFLEGLKSSFSTDDPELTASVLLSISIVEGVLCRCLELAELKLKD